MLEESRVFLSAAGRGGSVLRPWWARTLGPLDHPGKHARPRRGGSVHWASAVSLPLHEVQGTPEMASVSSLPSAGAQVEGKGLGEGSLCARPLPSPLTQSKSGFGAILVGGSETDRLCLPALSTYLGRDEWAWPSAASAAALGINHDDHACGHVRVWRPAPHPRRRGRRRFPSINDGLCPKPLPGVLGGRRAPESVSHASCLCSGEPHA